MKSLGYVTDMSKCQVCEHGLEYIMFYVQKHIAPLAVCSGTPLFRDGALGVPAFTLWN